MFIFIYLTSIYRQERRGEMRRTTYEEVLRQGAPASASSAAVQRCALSLHNPIYACLFPWDTTAFSLSPVPIVSICLIAFGWEIYMDERVRLVRAVCFYFSSFDSSCTGKLLATGYCAMRVMWLWEWRRRVPVYCAVYKMVRLSSYKCRTITRAHGLR